MGVATVTLTSSNSPIPKVTRTSQRGSPPVARPRLAVENITRVATRGRKTDSTDRGRRPQQRRRTGIGGLVREGGLDARGRQQRGPEEQQRGEQDAGPEEHRAEELGFAIADPTPDHPDEPQEGDGREDQDLQPHQRGRAVGGIGVEAGDLAVGGADARCRQQASQRQRPPDRTDDPGHRRGLDRRHAPGQPGRGEQRVVPCRAHRTDRRSGTADSGAATRTRARSAIADVDAVPLAQPEGATEVVAPDGRAEGHARGRPPRRRGGR